LGVKDHKEVKVKKKLKLSIVVAAIVVVSIFVMVSLPVSYCASDNTLTWSYSLEECKVVTEDKSSKLKLTVKCASIESMLFPRSLKFILSDPEGNTVDTGYISSDDFVDGKETIYLDMAQGYCGQPKPGTYYLVAKTSSGKEIYNDYLTFTGAKLSIEEIRGWYKKYSDGTCALNKISMKVRNNGDLPAIIYKGRVRAGNEEDDFLLSESVMPGDELTINETIWLAYLESGKYVMHTELYSKDGQLLASHQRNITLKKTKEDVKTLGFEAIFAIGGLLAVAYLVLRRRR